MVIQCRKTRTKSSMMPDTETKQKKKGKGGRENEIERVEWKNQSNRIS